MVAVEGQLNREVTQDQAKARLDDAKAELGRERQGAHCVRRFGKGQSVAWAEPSLWTVPERTMSLPETASSARIPDREAAGLGAPGREDL